MHLIADPLSTRFSRCFPFGSTFAHHAPRTASLSARLAGVDHVSPRLRTGSGPADRGPRNDHPAPRGARSAFAPTPPATGGGQLGDPRPARGAVSADPRRRLRLRPESAPPAL